MPSLASPILPATTPIIPPELRTVAQIRSAAAKKTNSSVKGAAPLTAMNSLRKLAEEAHLKEQGGDFRGALFQFVQVGVLYQEREMPSESDTGSLNRRSGNSLAERLKQLQGGGIQAELIGKRIQRPPSQNFRPQSPPALVPSRGPTPAPRGPTPGPYTVRRASISQAMSFIPPIPPASPKPPNGLPSPYVRSTPTPIPAGTSPRQFVPVANLGPPSPTHSAGSSPEEDEIQVPRVHKQDTPIRSPSDFSRAFPPIDELNERDPETMFPSVPTGIPGATRPPLQATSPLAMNGHKPNGLPWKAKAFPAVMDMEPRPASTPIPIKRQSAGSRPQTPAHLVGSPGQNHSPRTNGFATADQTPHVDLPITNSITPQKLNSLLETRGLNILLLDVRNRDSFERERINHDAIVCLEPMVLSRQGINSSMIEGAQVISPSTEQVLFKNRSRFDLIIMYDESSSSLRPNTSPMSALFRAIFENEFHRPLKRPPMILIGGLKAWKDAVGDDGVLRRVSPTSSAGSLPNDGFAIAPEPTGSTAGTSASEEETFLYDRRAAEIKYPPAEKLQPQNTGSDYSTETPGGNKLTARRPMSKPPLSSLQTQFYRPPKSPAPNGHSPHLVSTPDTRNGPIQYPSFPAPFTPPPAPTPPQAASVNQNPLSRRRNDFAEQGQQAYSGSIPPARPIDYPHLASQNVISPPPVAATATTTKLEPRSRVAQPQGPYSGPPVMPMIKSDYPVLYWAASDVGTSGLKNLGNTCYMNSVLQCLGATTPFARFFIDGRWQTAVNTINPLGSKGKFTEGYARLLVDMWRADMGALTPYPFRKTVCTYAPQFADSNQHDAQEFMIFLLDNLHEDLNRILRRQIIETRPEREAELERLPTQIASEQEWQLYRMTNNSIVVDYFQGQFRNRMECMTCHKTSTTYNTFMHLSLPVPDSKRASRVTLQQCLDSFVQQEVMEKNDAWNCPNCKTLRKATKVLTLCRLPPILLIHLKRFSFKGPFTEKIETIVEFPLNNLDLTGYMPAPLPPGLDTSAKAMYGKPQTLTPDDPRHQAPPYKYELFGVTNHYGTLSSGHYTAFVNSAGGWKYCDDSRITRADKNAVMTKAAYILFYKRTH
ncbi:ubiquitin-specific protease doa4 [Serendipita sp. 401]|nr:ubiquitin-specific protease doa4 [Serendipita sp. 401]